MATKRQRLEEKRRRNAAWVEWHARDPKAAALGAQAMYDHPDDRGSHVESPRGLSKAERLDGYVRASVLHRIKGKCRERGLPFDLTREDLPIPKTCEILGIPLFYSGALGPNTPTLDRVVPELGYVKGNVRIISSKANRMKQDSTLDQVKLIAAYIERHSQ